MKKQTTTPKADGNTVYKGLRLPLDMAAEIEEAMRFEGLNPVGDYGAWARRAFARELRDYRAERADQIVRENPAPYLSKPGKTPS